MYTYKKNKGGGSRRSKGRPVGVGKKQLDVGDETSVTATLPKNPPKAPKEIIPESGRLVSEEEEEKKRRARQTESDEVIKARLLAQDIEKQNGEKE